MGMRQAERAWSGTAMLARVRASRAEEVEQAFGTGTSRTISMLVAEIARGAMDGHALSHGQDAGRSMELGRLVLQAAADALTSQGAAARAQELIAALVHWIEHGQVAGAPDLQRIDQLVGGEPAIRLALLAPYAPALAMTGTVLRAREASYPLAGSVQTEACP
jgi:hypothetical protein